MLPGSALAKSFVCLLLLPIKINLTQFRFLSLLFCFGVAGECGVEVLELSSHSLNGVLRVHCSFHLWCFVLFYLIIFRLFFCTFDSCLIRKNLLSY